MSIGAPAVVETPVYGTFLSPEEVKEILPTFNGFHPLGRNGQPAELRKRFCFSLRSKLRGSLEPYYLSTEVLQPGASRGRRCDAHPSETVLPHPWPGVFTQNFRHCSGSREVNE
jgi:hypothetical protein